MKFVNEVISNELCFGKISAISRDKFVDIISNLANRGAKGVILGCTEIGLLVDQNSTNVKLFNTTFIHIDEAVNLAIC